jgi:hypothetical protein
MRMYTCMPCILFNMTYVFHVQCVHGILLHLQANLAIPYGLIISAWMRNSLTSPSLLTSCNNSLLLVCHKATCEGLCSYFDSVTLDF